MPVESKAAKQKRAQSILKQLQKKYPHAACELIHTNPLELAIAAILSAQCTDKRVNQVAPPLFKKYKTAQAWASIPIEKLEELIHSTGFFRNKAKSISNLCRVLADQFNGQLPDDFEQLVQLPGIGRKTANLLMVSAFNHPGIIVDTHCKRVSNRLDLTRQSNPDKIEMDLRALLPEKDWADFSHIMVFHGRYGCYSQKPECSECPLCSCCPHYRNVVQKEED